MMRKFRRVDLTNATEDYFLKVGEEAYISFSDATEISLRIATEAGTYYQLLLILSDQGGTSGGSGDILYLYPNNTSYTNQFVGAHITRYNPTGGYYTNWWATNKAFWLSHPYCNGFYYITNGAVRELRGIVDTYGRDTAYPCLRLIASTWRNNTTPWTILGTVVSPVPISGEILVRRLK